MQYRSWKAASFVIGHLPARAAYALAALIGVAGYYCWPRGRRAMLRNFRHVLPHAAPAEIRRVARASLVNYCRYLADFIQFHRFTARDLVDICHGEPAFAGLDAVLERGKGAIIVCMHFGNWDVGAGAAAARGYPLTVIAETFADPRLDAMVVGARRRLGMNVVAMERAAPSIFRALKANGLLALLIDRPVSGDGVTVEFFGRPIDVPAGAARIALPPAAAVPPAAFARHHPPRRDVSVFADFSVSPERTGDDREDIRRLTQAIVHAHERFIRAHPEQWYKFQEMWPRIPATASA
ncbi:MAG TPA: lysophospholipid acyltransferase family protein [Tepidiformaceae bacterium]|nr:lysophospholipid acyltransferase family protein [Tepidiformaceae bacterium]